MKKEMEIPGWREIAEEFIVGTAQLDILKLLATFHSVTIIIITIITFIIIIIIIS